MVQRVPWLLLTAGLSACSGEPQPAAPQPVTVESYDLVIAGGRVIDPESGLDAVRYVGIRHGLCRRRAATRRAVAAISESPLTGVTTVEAAGLVVAPGFIDLHAHGQDPVSSRFQAMDGVTTALELEIGAFPVDRWYARRGDASRINYGASVSHQGARLRALDRAMVRANAEGTFSLGESGDGALYRAADEDELARLGELMEGGLREGAIGFGFGLAYTPGASHRELLRLFEIAAAHEAPVFVHLRSSAAFTARRRAGAVPGGDRQRGGHRCRTLHIVHLNSTADPLAEEALAHDPRRPRSRRGRDDGGLSVHGQRVAHRVAALRRLGRVGPARRTRGCSGSTRASGSRRRRSSATGGRAGGSSCTGGPRQLNEWIVGQPDVIAASDGIPFSEGRAHPRGAGTFARILGHYVRERGVLSLMDALRKMTLLPAQRIEGIVPEMARKGRVQVGSDADLTIFDPERVIDRATYDAPDQYSAGIVHVLVGGAFVVRDGALVDGVQPGRPLRGRHLATGN